MFYKKLVCHLFLYPYYSRSRNTSLPRDTCTSLNNTPLQAEIVDLMQRERVSYYYQIISTVVCKCRCVATRNVLFRRFTIKFLIAIYSLPLESAVFDSSSTLSGEISSWTTTCANKKKNEKKKTKLNTHKKKHNNNNNKY